MEKITILKNWKLWFLVLVLSPFITMAQTHFTPATNNGAGNWHIYTVYANLDGVKLEAGDEIALYDGNVCVGARTLTAALDSSYNLAVGNDFIAYEANNGDPGYTGGNTYSWRCWDASASTEYVGSMVYDLTYTPQDFTGTEFPATMTFRWSWVGLTFTAVAPAAGDLSGNITESVGGGNIQGVSVTATGSSVYTTSTNVNGDYLFDNIDPDTYTVSTSHADYQDQSSAGNVVVDGGTTTKNFILVYKPGSITGTVTDQGSNPVDGATVAISGGASTTTNASGLYTLSSVAPGTYDLTASKSGYASSTETGVVVSPDAATTQNFTIVAAGTLSGTVTDGTNGGSEDGVLVTVVETGDFVTTAGGGLFSFDLSTGTYSLTFTKTGFHNSNVSGLSVTAGSTTNADNTIYEENWTFVNGDPFSDVWTIYLNNVTGDGTPLKAGDELSIWAPDNRGGITAFAPFKSGGISSVSASGSLAIGTSVTSFSSPANESGTITGVTDNGGGTAVFASTNSLSNGDNIDIFGTSNYNTSSSTVANVSGTNFETGTAFSFDETGYWVLSSSSTTTITTPTTANLVNGTSVTITGGSPYDGTYSISNVTATSFDIPVKWAGPFGSASWTAAAAQINTDAAHNLSDGDVVVITGTTNYNGTFTIAGASGSQFVITKAYISDETGSWADNSETTVTSTAHGLSNGTSITIHGTTNYNGTKTISNVSANTFDITDNYVAETPGGGAKWTEGEQMVGLYYLTGPINGAGTAHDLKAYSVLDDASIGYVAGEDFTFKLSYAGGSVLTTLNSTSWSSGSGLTDPGTTFPNGNKFSMVDLDFDLPPGDLDVKFVDEGSAAPDSDLSLTLKKDGSTVATGTFASGSTSYVNFAGLDAGTYTLEVSSDRFESTIYSNIAISPTTTTTKDFTINHFADETQTINLSSGYQLISRRVDGDSYDMSTYLGGTMAPTPPSLSNLDMTKDEDGTSDTYSGGAISTDGGVAWNIKRGYNFKMNAADAMVITGTPIAYSSDISIREVAYSMISYLPDYILDAEVAFADLMTNDLDFIRDKDGNSLTKVSGVWVDHIGNCNPGDGFLIKWNGGTGGNSFTFNYPAQSKSSSSVEEEAELVHFPFYNGYGNPMKNTYTMYVSGDDLEIGDEVAAFDGTTLVGATVITSSDPLDNDLKAFEELFDTQGFTSGNKIALKVWKANEDTEYWLNFTNVSEGENMYKGTTYPSEDGMKSTLELAFSPNAINDNLAEYINVYPNPSNGIVTISSPEKIDRLMVINIVGQTVLDIKPDSGNTQINLENLYPGVYFVNMILNGQKITKKLTIQ